MGGEHVGIGEHGADGPRGPNPLISGSQLSSQVPIVDRVSGGYKRINVAKHMIGQTPVCGYFYTAYRKISK